MLFGNYLFFIRFLNFLLCVFEVSGNYFPAPWSFIPSKLYASICSSIYRALSQVFPDLHLNTPSIHALTLTDSDAQITGVGLATSKSQMRKTLWQSIPWLSHDFSNRR